MRYGKYGKMYQAGFCEQGNRLDDHAAEVAGYKHNQINKIVQCIVRSVAGKQQKEKWGYRSPRYKILDKGCSFFFCRHINILRPQVRIINKI